MMAGDSLHSPTAVRRTTTSQSFKVVLLGEGCVGKTSLVLRYTEDKFNDKHVSTLQVIGDRLVIILIVTTAVPNQDELML